MRTGHSTVKNSNQNLSCAQEENLQINSSRCCDSSSPTRSTVHLKPDLGSSGDRLIATLIYRTRASVLSNGNSLPAPNSSEDVSTVLPASSSSEAILKTSSDHNLSSAGFLNPFISSLCIKKFQNLVLSLLIDKESTVPSFSQRFLDRSKDPSVIELTFSKIPNQKCRSLLSLNEHELIHKFERDWNIDVIFQIDTVFRRYPRLVCFDMDSTLIQEEIIDLIADFKGVKAEVSAITDQAMNGEIDFLESLKSRVKLLEGIDEDIFLRLRSLITPTKGVKELIRALKKIGARTAVFSGGFLPTVAWLAEELGIDYAHANILSTSNGHLNGELEGEIVNAERKRTLLCEIAKEEGINLNQTVAVGDGANDLLMLKAAGLGVAWNAKPYVQKQVRAKLNRESLLDLLYLFGFTAEEIEMLTS